MRAPANAPVDPDGRKTPCNCSLECSDINDDLWLTVKTWVHPKGPNEFAPELTFPPRLARYWRLNILSTHGGDRKMDILHPTRTAAHVYEVPAKQAVWDTLWVLTPGGHGRCASMALTNHTILMGRTRMGMAGSDTQGSGAFR